MADHSDDNDPIPLLMEECDSENDSDDDKYISYGKDSCNEYIPYTRSLVQIQ